LLTDGRHISISHTKGIVAVVISEHHPVGVDVEYNSDRVSRVAKRFVREDEWTEDVKSLLIMWSAKETVYKLFSEDSLWYDEMRVVPFQVLAEGNLEVENLKRGNSVQVYYQINKEYVLTYSIL
jgi:4'-phosphopantetheinyl transferase EntD